MSDYYAHNDRKNGQNQTFDYDTGSGAVPQVPDILGAARALAQGRS